MKSGTNPSQKLKDAVDAFSANTQSKPKKCVKTVNDICKGSGAVGLMDADRLYDPSQTCIEMTNKDGAADYVVFYAKNTKDQTGFPGLISIIPLDESVQRCTQIQLHTKAELNSVVRFGDSVAVATGGGIFEFHKKQMKDFSAFFVNRILNKAKKPYTSVKSIEQLPDASKVLVTTTNKLNFVIDEEAVSIKSGRAEKVGAFKSNSDEIKELILNPGN